MVIAPRKAAVLAGIGIGITGAVFVFIFLSGEQAHACAEAADETGCFTRESARVAVEDGVSQALAFVHEVVAPNSNYRTVHLSLHYIGYQAFDEAGSVKEALAAMPERDAIVNDFFYYNGFQHGVFTRFFEMNADQTPMDLTKEACDGYTSIASLSDVGSSTGILAAECYHAIGHSIMYISGNDIEDSLEECDVFPNEWMREWCYHGVFMENYYLYIPSYQEGVARPGTLDASPAAMCLGLAAPYRAQCSYFAGIVYIMKHPGDAAGVFAECAKFPDAMARICVARVGRSAVAPSLKGTIGDAIAVCAGAGKFENECLYGTAVGLEEGNATLVERGRGSELCEMLEGETRSGCAATVLRVHESLSRMYATEI